MSFSDPPYHLETSLLQNRPPAAVQGQTTELIISVWDWDFLLVKFVEIIHADLLCHFVTGLAEQLLVLS